MGWRFEDMTEGHGKEVMDIFNYYIDNSFAAYPEEKLPYAFFAKFLEMAKGYPAKVIINDEDGRVVGFCLLRAHNPMPAFKQTAEISYFIRNDEVGKGIGQNALRILEGEAKNRGIKYLLANISSLNEQSIRFHKNNGFVECGRFLNIGKNMTRILM